MKILIDVESVAEGRELRRGLADPMVRQFVRITAALGAHDMRPHTLCGPRCFLEFLEALITSAAMGPHPVRGPDGGDDPERSDS